MCRVLQVSRSGYYAWFSLRQSLEDKYRSLGGAILESWVDSYKLYGSRRIVKGYKGGQRYLCFKEDRAFSDEEFRHLFCLPEEEVQEGLQDRGAYMLS